MKHENNNVKENENARPANEPEVKVMAVPRYAADGSVYYEYEYYYEYAEN